MSNKLPNPSTAEGAILDIFHAPHIFLFKEPQTPERTQGGNGNPRRCLLPAAVSICLI